jgi:carboxylesterase
MTHSLLPGAEPWSVTAGPVGVLCLHGFTGNPTSMRGVAHAFAAEGYSVELPRLPGHGTSVEDMLTTSWADWSAAAADAYDSLAARCQAVFVAGLSMGGSLTLWLGAERPATAGLICINPATQPQPPEVLEMVRGMLAEGQHVMPGIGSDIADPDVVESAYEGTPLRPLLSLMEDGLAPLAERYGSVTVPLLLMTSPQDHVVDPAQSDALAAAYGGPVHRVTLERSYHVATLDYDRALIHTEALAFARRVTGA